MNRIKHNEEAFGLELTAHEEEGQRLLLVRIAGIESRDEAEEAPLNVALVIDRSGSMCGPKLAVAKEAAARFVETLGGQDRVAAVVYDDGVDTIFGLKQPSAELARRLRSLETGGSTNLYGGWKEGVDLVGEDGYVVLLSDGLANVGRYTDAHSLAAKAKAALRRSRVHTTTVGIGMDYDERLMSMMAKEGGGGHYFAHTADAILEALAQERFAIGAASLLGVRAIAGAKAKELGTVFAGETRSAVLEISDLSGGLTIEYRLPGEKEARTAMFVLPTSFGISHEATAEKLAAEAQALMESALDVQSSHAAAEIVTSLRGLILKVLAHPLADEPLLNGIHQQLDEAHRRAKSLAEYWSEEGGTVFRKRSGQSAMTLREPSRAFSSFAEDRQAIADMRTSSYTHVAGEVSEEALALRPADYWRNLRVIPRKLVDGLLTIALLDPKDRFAVDDIGRELGVRVRVSRRLASQAELDALGH
ncbi:MAG: VWA domain-containing protein [Armatimonadetes bacterium]|nr:VWA domain-containing protein [Armatimonadota bacterium]